MNTTKFSQQNFFSVKDAAQNSRKSASTIRRLLRSIVHNDSHPDRVLIKPSPKEFRILKTKRAPFQWKLSETLLRRTFGTTADDAIPSTDRTATPREGSNVLSILEKELTVKERNLQEILQQLKVKDHQIARQADIIEALNERVREGNILIGTIQRQLALPSPLSTKKHPHTRKKEAVRRRSGLLKWLLG